MTSHGPRTEGRSRIYHAYKALAISIPWAYVTFLAKGSQRGCGLFRVHGFPFLPHLREIFPTGDLDRTLPYTLRLNPLPFFSLFRDWPEPGPGPGDGGFDTRTEGDYREQNRKINNAPVRGSCDLADGVVVL